MISTWNVWNEAHLIRLSWQVNMAWCIHGARWARNLTVGFGVVGWGWRA